MPTIIQKTGRGSSTRYTVNKIDLASGQTEKLTDCSPLTLHDIAQQIELILRDERDQVRIASAKRKTYEAPVIVGRR